MYRFAFAAAAAVFAAPVAAAVITFDITLTGGVVSQGEQIQLTAPAFTPITVSPGDIFELTLRLPVTFNAVRPASEQSLFIDLGVDNNALWRASGTSTYELLNPTGNLVASGVGFYPDSRLGRGLYVYTPATGPVSGSFDGIRITYQVVSGPTNTIDYLRLITGAVPEPVTWAMMIAGFGMAGAAARRRVSYTRSSR